jgi:diacylglycerol kinase family enzyme
LVWLMIRAMFGRLEPTENFEVMVVDDLTIRAGRHVRVSIDGELVELKSPLHYEVQAGVLNVLTPTARDSLAVSRDGTPTRGAKPQAIVEH